MEKPIDYYESRTFTCKKCGCQVVTKKGILDKRTVFCSSICSRRYWRHSDIRKKKSSDEQLNKELLEEKNEQA